jgi:DNA-binding response OmpR family regulator
VASSSNILLVEDDHILALMLRDRLTAQGYCVWHAQSGAEAELLVGEVLPDLIIIDLMLPDTHGLVLCAKLSERQDAPIIICSGTRRKDDAVLGLKLGAVDFIAKPFSGDELEQRVAGALRRAAANPTRANAASSGTRVVGPLAIDEDRCQVTLAGEDVRATPTEYRLLRLLAERANRVVSRKELAEEVWGYHDPAAEHTLDVHLRRLRGKLKAGPVPAPALSTVRGFGYLLKW